VPDSVSWNIIYGADSNQVVLAVDFPAARYSEASFTELAVAIGSGYRFLQAAPRTSDTRRGIRGVVHASRWLDAIRQEQCPVRAVFGYGVGGVYAASIAQEISQWQPTPKVFLFDPQLASTKLLGREFCREISSVSSLLSDDEAERARKIAAEVNGRETRDVADIAAELVEGYLEVIAVAFERAGLGDARSSKFTVSFESYMSWISAAARIDPGRVWAHSIAIASSDYIGSSVRENFPDGVSNPIGQIGRWISFDERCADLLRSDTVAEAVLNLLELESSCPRLRGDPVHKPAGE
jgi:hypothetical protein